MFVRRETLNSNSAWTGQEFHGPDDFSVCALIQRKLRQVDRHKARVLFTGFVADGIHQVQG